MLLPRNRRASNALSSPAKVQKRAGSITWFEAMESRQMLSAALVSPQFGGASGAGGGVGGAIPRAAALLSADNSSQDVHPSSSRVQPRTGWYPQPDAS